MAIATRVRQRDDADYQQFHTETVRRLTHSVRLLVSDLRQAGSNDAARQRAATAFIGRHQQVLGQAYEEAHAEGSRSYWESVKQRGYPASPPSTEQVRQCLRDYAVVSCAQMAHEALQAFRAPVTLDEGQFVDWEDSLGARINLQAEIVRPGLNDGADAARALLLSESMQTLERFDAVERGMVFYNHVHLPNGRFGPSGGGASSGGSGGGGTGGKAAPKAKGGGGGGAGASTAPAKGRAAKAAPLAPKAPKAAKAKVAPKTAKPAAHSPKTPTVAELKAAAELRVKTATTHAAKAEREYKAAEKAAEQKRTNNAAEINRLSNERHRACGKEFESHGGVRDLVADQRAHANGLAGKAPKAYAKMLAAKQPMEDARAVHATAAAKAAASKAHAEELQARYLKNTNTSRMGVGWHERMMKEHPDFKAAQRQAWKDESVAYKAKLTMWRKEGTYKAARDTVAGNTGVKGKAAFEAAVEAHPTRIAAKAALAAADAQLGAATGETAPRAAFQAREAARNELKDAQSALAHPTWKYPLHSAPTVHAQYTHPDQFPAGTLSAARAADPRGRLDQHAGDRALAELQHAQRFDGKPDIVSEAALNAHVKSGEVELWRGDTQVGHTDDLMMGEHHAGLGVHGSGTYTALASAGGHGVARNYAKSSGNDGLIMRMSVKKDARVIEYDHLKELAHQAVEHAQREEKAAQARGDKAGGEGGRTLNWLASPHDQGASRYAVALGYDAINVNTSRSLKGQWIILNRTALRISHQVRGD